jgi:PTH1 family peptidyl-tRNA hydrolase
MKLIIGLGNPGKEYENTRHNFGFMAVLNFYQHHGDIFGSWKAKFNALMAEGVLQNEKIILVRPQTLMNNSGRAVLAAAKFYKLLPNLIDKLLKKNLTLDSIWVIHDDRDLPLGVTRLSLGSESGGHQGVESVIKSLGTKNFIRFRLGLGPKSQDLPTDKFVLERFNQEEMKQVAAVLDKTTSALDGALSIGIARVMNEYNR